MERPLRLVVLADSTSFTDDRGPQLPDEPTLYPNVAARELGDRVGREVAVTVVARAGTTALQAWQTVTKDRHVQFDVLQGADAVIVGIGSFDHAPGGIPPIVEALVPYLRPSSARRGVRKVLHRAYPWAVRVRRGRTPRTTPAEFERLYDGLLYHVRALAKEAAGAVVGPTSHRSAYYAHRHPGHADGEARQFAIARKHLFACVSCWQHAEPYADRLNADGIHWPAEVHAAIGAELAERLAEQLEGRVPKPEWPGVGMEQELQDLAASARSDRDRGSRTGRAKAI